MQIIQSKRNLNRVGFYVKIDKDIINALKENALQQGKSNTLLLEEILINMFNVKK